MPTGLRQLVRTPETEPGFPVRVRENFDRLRNPTFVLTPYRQVSSDTQLTVDDTDGTLACLTNAGDILVGLLSANGVAGRTHTVKNCGTGGNDVTIKPFGDEDIDGATQLVLTDGQVARLTATGMGWIRI